MNASRVPPNNLDAEGAVLSALMLDPKRIVDVEQTLRPEDFYSQANATIAKAIWSLDEEGAQVDVVSVATWLQARDKLQNVGGTPYLAQIADTIPAVAHVVEHAKTVAAAARVRRVLSTCQLVVAEAYTVAMQDVETWLQSVERRVFEAADSASIRADTVALHDEAVAAENESLKERVQHRKLPGQEVRLRGLDRILGGLVDAVPYVVAGRPGHGKTSLAWQMVAGIAASGALGVFLSQEMPREQLVQRAIAQSAGVEMRAIQYGRLSAADWNSVSTAMQYTGQLPIAIDDRAGHTVHSVRSSVRRCVQKLRAKGHDGRLGVVALDYLQLMASDGHGGTDEASRANQLEAQMNGLRELAKEFRCPILVLSQLNRSIEKRDDKRPNNADLSGSGAIEAAAYGIIFVYRHDMYREREQHDGKAELIVTKNRNGRMGTAHLRYMPSTLFVADADVQDDYDEFDNFAEEAGYGP